MKINCGRKIIVRDRKYRNAEKYDSLLLITIKFRRQEREAKSLTLNSTELINNWSYVEYNIFTVKKRNSPSVLAIHPVLEFDRMFSKKERCLGITSVLRADRIVFTEFSSRQAKPKRSKEKT